jgi:hypothetical protein
MQAQDRLQQHERRAGGPGLRDVGTKVLNGKAAGLSLVAGVEFGQLVLQEVAGRLAHVAGDVRRLGGVAVSSSPIVRAGSIPSSVWTARLVRKMRAASKLMAPPFSRYHGTPFA